MSEEPNKTTCPFCLGPATVIIGRGLGREIRCDQRNKSCSWYVRATPKLVEEHRERYDGHAMVD